jgi:DNA-binding transcriptional LysR family regulator
MSQIPTWFDRQFDFSFPLELHPNLCIRLRGAPARLEELVQGCAREALVRKPDDKWSAQEHAGHLLDLESLWLARVHDFAGNRGELTVADLTNRKTHEANHNARPVKDILAEFRKARLALVGSVQAYDPTVFARTLLHPRLKKPMRLVDHLYFVAEHDDHHLAWIWHLTHAT